MSDGNVKAPPDHLQARLDYAWEWFKYHASQRVSMFYYFLIIIGILANAYVGLLKDFKPFVKGGSWVLGTMGALTAIGFVMLDVRNKSLVDRASAVLHRLENDELSLGNGLKLADSPSSKRLDLPWLVDLLRSHTLWIRLIEGLIAVGFLALAIFADPIEKAANVAPTAEAAKATPAPKSARPAPKAEAAKAGPAAKPAKPAAKPGS